MAWVALAESGLNYEFVPGTEFSGPFLNDSTVECEDEGGSAASWQLLFEFAQTIRVTISTFTSTGDSSEVEFSWDGGGAQGNTAPQPAESWTPSPFTTGETAELAFDGGDGEFDMTYSMLIEVFFPDPPPTPPTCQEIGRVTRAYVSAYDRARVQVVRVRRQAKRCLVANFNGAIPPARSIVSARWSCTSPWVTYMSNASISADQRETMVLVDFQNPGWGAVKVTATLDNGEVYNQVFEGVVRDIPWFNENLPIANGPYSLTATAP